MADEVFPKPTVPEVLPLVRALYATAHGAVGGCLHVVLDDNNVGDGSVQFCIDHAREQGCQQCITLGELLLRMSKTQRLKLAGDAYAPHDTATDEFRATGARAVR